MKYAACKRCEVVIPRDDMFSVNVHFYQESDRREILRIRLCPNCHKDMYRDIKAVEWKNELLPGRGVSRPKKDAPWVVNVSHLDDSEAAMRKKGKRVDVTY